MRGAEFNSVPVLACQQSGITEAKRFMLKATYDKHLLETGLTEIRSGCSGPCQGKIWILPRWKTPYTPCIDSLHSDFLLPSVSYWNISCCNLCLLPLGLSLCNSQEVHLPSLQSFLRYLKAAIRHPYQLVRLNQCWDIGLFHPRCWTLDSLTLVEHYEVYSRPFLCLLMTSTSYDCKLPSLT